MKFKVTENINAPVSKVWDIITNIENAKNVISGIEEVEVLNKPESGLLGLKWKETRTLFGKTAVETMWITDVEDQNFYRTRAESHGAIYISQLSVEEVDGKTLLTMEFSGTPVSFGAKVMNAMMGWMFKGPTIKALKQDLVDIKVAAES